MDGEASASETCTRATSFQSMHDDAKNERWSFWAADQRQSKWSLSQWSETYFGLNNSHRFMNYQRELRSSSCHLQRHTYARQLFQCSYTLQQCPGSAWTQMSTCKWHFWRKKFVSISPLTKNKIATIKCHCVLCNYTIILLECVYCYKWLHSTTQSETLD